MASRPHPVALDGPGLIWMADKQQSGDGLPYSNISKTATYNLPSSETLMVLLLAINSGCAASATAHVNFLKLHNFIQQKIF